MDGTRWGRCVDIVGAAMFMVGALVALVAGSAIVLAIAWKVIRWAMQ